MEASRKIALILEYDGTGYAGFQLQRSASTIQGELEKAIASLTGKATRIQAAGRTDAGVHARGQVAAFLTAAGLSCQRIVMGLNHYLPPDIAVQQAHQVSLSFDPRRQARSRTYRYTILMRRTPSPLQERLAYRVAEPLDAGAMQAALGLLQGSHDFGALAGSPGPGRSTIREVYATRLWQQEDRLNIEIEANAFLPHQMRRMAGMLVSVGAGRLSLEGVAALLERRAGAEHVKLAPTLPPHGLCLIEVRYKDFPPHEHQTQQDL
ncbi:MAG: tRNA pseudouridine(38-40) synthase TruA [Chloroflexi bacterium]|nr:tRNA pseudouridine(38-40) synthase TruA [Chloroflexota bacterium]